MTRKTKKNTLSIYIKLFKKPFVFLHLMVTISEKSF